MIYNMIYMIKLWYGMRKYDMTYDMIYKIKLWYSMRKYDMTYDMIWLSYDIVWENMIWHMI